MAAQAMFGQLAGLKTPAFASILFIKLIELDRSND